MAGDSFATTASLHLLLFTMSQALAGSQGHRNPAFEEFIEQLSEQMMPVVMRILEMLKPCDNISSKDSTMGLWPQ